MGVCSKCGAPYSDGQQFCTSCGASLSVGAPNMGTPGSAPNGNSFESEVKNLLKSDDSTASFDAADIEQNKMLALFSYLGILVLIPILAAPNSKFARFHANQGLVLCICEIAWSIIATIITAILGVIGFWVLSLLFGLVAFVVWVVFLVFVIMGIVNAVGGKAKALPLLGNITILK